MRLQSWQFIATTIGGHYGKFFCSISQVNLNMNCNANMPNKTDFKNMFLSQTPQMFKTLITGLPARGKQLFMDLEILDLEFQQCI